VPHLLQRHLQPPLVLLRLRQRRLHQRQALRLLLQLDQVLLEALALLRAGRLLLPGDHHLRRGGGGGSGMRRLPSSRQLRAGAAWLPAGGEALRARPRLAGPAARRA
jgi:hypothetical protein